MSWAAWFTLSVVTLGVGALIWEILAPDFIFLGMLAVLIVSGVLSPEEALVGFANPGMIRQTPSRVSKKSRAAKDLCASRSTT